MKLFVFTLIGAVLGSTATYLFLSHAEIKNDAVQVDQNIPAEKIQNADNTQKLEEPAQLAAPPSDNPPPVESNNLATSTKSKCEDPAPCPCLFSNEDLQPPTYDLKNATEVSTNYEGEVLVRWLKVDGAKKYEIYVEDSAGKLVKKYSTSRLGLYLKDIPLPPGKLETNYIIKIAAVNGKDIAGKKGQPLNLHVKPQATVVAPEIEEIKVED